MSESSGGEEGGSESGTLGPGSHGVAALEGDAPGLHGERGKQIARGERGAEQARTGEEGDRGDEMVLDGGRRLVAEKQLHHVGKQELEELLGPEVLEEAGERGAIAERLERKVVVRLERLLEELAQTGEENRSDLLFVERGSDSRPERDEHARKRRKRGVGRDILIDSLEQRENERQLVDRERGKRLGERAHAGLSVQRRGRQIVIRAHFVTRWKADSNSTSWRDSRGTALSWASRASLRPTSLRSILFRDPYTQSNRCERVSPPKAVPTDSPRSAAPPDSTMHRSRFPYADRLVQNAQARSDLCGVRRILAQRVLCKQHLPRKQLEQHAAKSEHVRRHELLQVQGGRVQFFGSQVARLQNAFVGARETLRGEAVVLHQILPRLLEFYVPTQPFALPIEMWPCSFRISWGFGFSFVRIAPISGAG